MENLDHLYIQTKKPINPRDKEEVAESEEYTQGMDQKDDIIPKKETRHHKQEESVLSDRSPSSYGKGPDRQMTIHNVVKNTSQENTETNNHMLPDQSNTHGFN